MNSALYFTFPLSVIIIFGLAVGLGIFLTRKYNLRWRLYWIGAALFVVAQILHIPFNIILNQLFRNDVLPLPPEQYQAFLQDLRGAVIGRKLADRFGWEVGDTFFLESFIPPYRKPDGPFEFVVSGVFDVDEGQVLVDDVDVRDWNLESLRSQISTIEQDVFLFSETLAENIAFGQPTIAVDTHIFRVSNRTGIAKGKTPLAVEKNLLKFTPDEYKLGAHHWLILHGRYTCKARKPDCPACVIRDLCEYRHKTPEAKK